MADTTNKKRKYLSYRITAVEGADTENNVIIDYFHKKWKNKSTRRTQIADAIKNRVETFALINKFISNNQQQEKDIELVKRKIVFTAIRQIADLRTLITEIEKEVKENLGIDISELIDHPSSQLTYEGAVDKESDEKPEDKLKEVKNKDLKMFGG